MSQVAGLVGAAAFAWLCLFQVLLALGMPMGAMAWGGSHRVLPRSLRVASLFSALLAGLGLVTVAQASGLVEGVLPHVVLGPLLFALTALFALSFVGNVASQSRLERLHGVPLTLVLATCCVVLALSGTNG